MFMLPESHAAYRLEERIDEAEAHRRVRAVGTGSGQSGNGLQRFCLWLGLPWPKTRVRKVTTAPIGTRQADDGGAIS